MTPPENAPSTAWRKHAVPVKQIGLFGAALRTYFPFTDSEARRRWATWLAAAGAVLLVGGAALIYPVLGLEGRGVSEFILLAAAVPLIGVGLLGAAGLCLWMVDKTVSAWRVYPEGFVELRGGEARPFAWTRIRRCWQGVAPAGGGIGAGPRTKLLVERDDGLRAAIDPHSGDEALLAADILRGTLGPLLARAVKTLEGGGSVDCGPVRVKRGGLSLGGQQLAWDDIRSASVEHGLIRVVLTNGALRTAPVTEAPNSHILPDLIARLRDQATRP